MKRFSLRPRHNSSPNCTTAKRTDSGGWRWLAYAKQRLPHRILFFFSNRRPEDAPFLVDLQALQKENPNYTFIPSMTESANSHDRWNGETGNINKEMLAKYLSAAYSPINYIVGPPGTVKALHSMVNEPGVILVGLNAANVI